MQDSKLFAFRAGDDIARLLDTMPQRSDFIKRCIQFATSHPDFSPLGNVAPATQLENVSIPLFDISIAAGFPLGVSNSEQPDTTDLAHIICPHPEHSQIIHVRGNSMIDANIFDGDMVIVDTTVRNPGPTQVAVCELNGEYTLKRFERRGNMGYLIPANPDYPEMPVNPTDDFHIWGIVTYVIHKPTR